MQTKNVNLPQPAECSAPLSSGANQQPAPPPLPPRGPGQQVNPADGAGKPVPPPYRQPPQPQGPSGALGNSEPLIPGMMMATASGTSGETLATFVTHSAKFPVAREREISLPGPGSPGDKKIPLLAEMMARGGNLRPRSSAAGTVGPRANAWTEGPKQHQHRPLHQRLRTLLSHSPVEHQHQNQSGEGPMQKAAEVTTKAEEGDGEALLIRPRKHSSVPEGIDNPGLEKLDGYVPSQPHQRVQGPRGHLILERPPPAAPPSGDIYRALRVIPTAEDDHHRSAPGDHSGGNWSASEDGHTTHRLRDACNRLYHRGHSATSTPQAFKASTSTPSLYGSAKSLPEYAVHQQRPPSCGPQRYYMLKDMMSGEEAEERVVASAEPPMGHQPAESPRTGKLDTSCESEATGGSSSYFSAKGHEIQTGGRGVRRHSHERRGSGDTHTIGSTTVSESMSVTPPLPPLSPGNSPPNSPKPTARLPSKYKLSLSSGALHKATPDILEATHRRGNPSSSSRNQSSSGKKSSSSRRSGSSSQETRNLTSVGHRRHSSSSSTVAVSGSRPSGHYGRTSRSAPSYHQTQLARSLSNIHELQDAEMTSTTTGLDMDSLLDDVDSSDEGKTNRRDGDDEDEDDDGDEEDDVAIHDIRQQLEALENMYSEVLNLLGVKNPLTQQMQQRTIRESSSKTSRKKVFGSLTSLTAKGNPRSKERSRCAGESQRKPNRETKGIGRRFQRLESHVVTLARSVAHLSSEMRTQHIMFQELESLRREVAQLHEQQVALARLNQANGQMKGTPGGPLGRGPGRHSHNRQSAATEWENFRSSVPSLTNPARVKKLTKFFGDEPPLLRLFLKKLGYEKYAVSFETERIGMIELPYLTEEQLQKIGIPLGPRMRILQEAQMSFRQEHFNIYIV